MALGNRREVRITVGADSRGWTGLRGASEYVDLSPRTVRGLMKYHEFPFQKLPTGTLRFSYAAIDSWMEQWTGKSKVQEIADKLIDKL